MKAALRTFLTRLGSLFYRRRFEADMVEEMQAHLAVLTASNEAAGMTCREARLAAQKQFGGQAQLAEACRDERAFVSLEQLVADIRFSVRALARARGFSLTILITLTLGLTVATAVFNLAGTFLFIDPPFPHPEQLCVVGYSDKHTAFLASRTGLHLEAMREQTTAFSEFAAVKRDMANVVINGEPIVSSVLSVAADSFHLFGIEPVLGRGFRPDEHRAGAADVTIISNRFWR